MHRLTGFLCLALTGCVAPDVMQVQGDNTTSSAAVMAKKSAIDEQMRGWLNTYGVPAAAVAYIENGEVAWASTYGELRSGGPATDETLFNIASMTKPITAETILRLAALGEIDLDEPMSAYWIDPDIKADPRHARLTARMALQHRTGFPNWRYQTDGVLQFQYEPDARSLYSGEGYNYVARFAEKKMGRPFETLAEELVFKPNGMTETSFTRRDWFDGRLSQPHNKDGETREASVRETWNAADDVYTTPADYASFIVSVMNNEGVSPDIAAIRHQPAENQFAKGCPFPPQLCPVSVGFGLGWAVFAYETDTVIMQGGGDWGERTLGFFVPERNIGVVVFTNSANGSKVIRDVAKILYPENPSFHGFLEFQAQ